MHWPLPVRRDQDPQGAGARSGSPSPAVPDPFPASAGLIRGGSTGATACTPEDGKSIRQRAGVPQLSRGSSNVAASWANSLPSRVIWAVSGARSAPRHPALRTALPALQYRLHVRRIASGCSHRGLSHRIASRPAASRSGCHAALLLAAAGTGGGGGGEMRARGCTPGSTEPLRSPDGTSCSPPRGALSPRGREGAMPVLLLHPREPGAVVGRRGGGRAGRAGRPRGHRSRAGHCGAGVPCPPQHGQQPHAHLRPRAWLRCSAASPRCTCAW